MHQSITAPERVGPSSAGRLPTAMSKMCRRRMLSTLLCHDRPPVSERVSKTMTKKMPKNNEEDTAITESGHYAAGQHVKHEHKRFGRGGGESNRRAQRTSCR